MNSRNSRKNDVETAHSIFWCERHPILGMLNFRLKNGWVYITHRSGKLLNYHQARGADARRGIDNGCQTNV